MTLRTRLAPQALSLLVLPLLALSAAGAHAQASPANDPAARTGPDWEGADWSPKPPVLPLSPAEERSRFILQPGYRMDAVLTDPQIQQPGSIAFDANGRMYVLELRTYMLDADAKEELAPRSRISRWEDRDNDGDYETGTVFVDGLIFPRFVTPLGDGVILTKESNAGEVWMYTDTDRDGRADKRELFTTDFGRSANVEHQEAELTWGMDNWMYATRNAIRLRWTPNGAIREPIGNPGGSWGITQDDDGKIYSQGGASGLPGYFQFPVHYGEFAWDDQLDEGLRTPYGAPVRIADMQGGMDQVRMPDGSLSSTTAGAGADVFRGHRLPEELKGDYFYGEVVARIVRRLDIMKNEGLTRMVNVYQPQQAEFIRSTDPLFRPLGMQTAPDGTMYIVDMYHGIIQEGQWSQPGSYLRARIDQYQLDKVVDLGRIWRLSYEGMERDRTQPRMYDETTAQLVQHLTHPNGWWRDMAQQQIVLRQDRSVAPALRTMARSHSNLVARFHALWALEGIGSLDAALVREAMRDTNPRMRIQAMRVSETLYKAGDKSFAADYRALASDPDPEVAAHALLTLNVLRVPDATTTIRTVQAANRAAGVQHVANEILNAPDDTGLGGNSTVQRSPAERALLARGIMIFRQTCTECHGTTGLGTAVGEGQLMAPALAGNRRITAHPEYLIRTLLHGMTGPIEGRNYAGGVMIPLGATQDDEWVAAVASYVRTNLTNNSFTVTPEQVARVRAANAGRTTPWTHAQLVATVPTLVAQGADWKASASHRAPTRIGMTGDPLGAFDFEGWTTGTPQQPGMWWQLELPQALNLTEIHFYSPNGGGGGGGGNNANAPPPQTTAPRGYRVELSTDGTNWTPVAEGGSTGNVTAIAWTPRMARFVRITQTATTPDAPAWSMLDTKLYALPSAR